MVRRLHERIEGIQEGSVTVSPDVSKPSGRMVTLVDLAESLGMTHAGVKKFAARRGVHPASHKLDGRECLAVTFAQANALYADRVLGRRR